MLFKPLNSLTEANYSPSSRHRVYSLITISFSSSASSLILSEVLQPLLSLYCPRSLEQTPKRHPSVCSSPYQPLKFISHPLALSSATFHSRLKTEFFKLSYPDSTPEPPNVRHHHRLQS